IRTLTVYVGAQGGTATLTAHLSDASAADYVNTYKAGSQRSDGFYTLTYRAASAGQKITVTWMVSGGPKASLGGRPSAVVSLQAAALAGSTPAPPPGTYSCPCTLWSSAAVPAVPADGDPNSVELGVKFTSDAAGLITGIRFYKSTTNTGTHVGSLWSITGTLLAQATFTNETASGWQQVNFATP